MKPEEIERSYAAGECLLERGAESRELLVVRSGNVLLQSEESSAEYLLGPGDFLGEAGAFLSRPHPYRAVAEGETTVLALGSVLLEKLCRENAEIAFRLLRGLAERGSRGNALEASARTPSQRALASAILARAVAGEGASPVKGKLADLADAAKLSIREGYEVLQVMLEQRLIGLVDDQLTILDPVELEALTQR